MMVKRRVLSILMAVVGFSVLSAGPSIAFTERSNDPEWIGSESCNDCHQIQYKGWVNTFHSLAVKNVKKNPSVIMGDMKEPDLPFKVEDIWFTVGGHFDQRYLTKIDNDFVVLPRLWSVQSKKWRPYSTYGWQKRSYSKLCLGCHSIGFDPKTSSIVEHRIGCESCHGPGRKHVGDPRRENIVNPKRLSEDRQEEICAQCHVRGKDLTGDYFFPIGYKAGQDLSKFLVPLDKLDDESDAKAIHRLWDKWKNDREGQARSRCEVCGIAPTKGKSVSARANFDAVCVGCHDYGENWTKHTRHKPDTPVACGDCHQQKPVEMNEKKDENVHSFGFFLIHPRGCWDKEIYKRCNACHTDKTQEWAYDTFNGWKKPVTIDH